MIAKSELLLSCPDCFALLIVGDPSNGTVKKLVVGGLWRKVVGVGRTTMSSPESAEDERGRYAGKHKKIAQAGATREAKRISQSNTVLNTSPSSPASLRVHAAGFNTRFCLDIQHVYI